MVDQYTEQYERMKRSYDRFQEIKHGIEHTKPSVYYEDDVYAFFMHCWHLKDWIKNDPTVKSKIPTIDSDVEQFATNSTSISLCADLCNSLKHLQLNRGIEVGKTRRLVRSY